MISKIFLIAVFILSIHSTAYATCSKSYTLGFFNGVWNTSGEASESTYKLQDLIGNTYNNEPVKYVPFYNHTGSTIGSNGLQDLAETFIQRSAEIDKSGVMGKRFEYFWEFLGSSEPTFLDKIKGIFPNAASLFDALYTTFATKLAAIVSGILSNPPTEADYIAHNAALDALAADGQKLMLVGHSQGNLFMNHAYDHILPVVTKERVAAAHIAPASIMLNGDYVLADIDLVINAMRVQGVSSVPANNLDLNSSSADVSGHTFIGTYLDGTREGRGKIKTMIEVAMGGLKDSCVLEYFFARMEQTFPYGNGMPEQIRSSWCHKHLQVTGWGHFLPFPMHLFPDLNAPLLSDFFTGLAPVYSNYSTPSNWSTSCSFNMLLDYFRHIVRTTGSNRIQPIGGELYIDGHPYILELRLTEV